MNDPTPFAPPAPVRQPVRVNKRMIGAAVAGGGIVVAGVLVWVTWRGEDTPKPKREPKIEQAEVGMKFPTTYDRPPSFPTTYAVDHQVPATAPPAPPPVAPTQPLRPTAAPTPPARPPGPLSPIFAPTSGDPAATQFERTEQAAAGGALTAGQTAVGANFRADDGTDAKLDPDSRQGLQGQKNSWLARVDSGAGGRERVSQPMLGALPHQLQTGTIIPAALMTEINTDLPGDCVALITADMYDSATGAQLLIPAGSKLFGSYNSQLAYGQTRVQIAWSRILFRNGTSQTIGAMVGTDAAGSAGAEGDVDHHNVQMAGAIGLSALMSIVSQAGQLLQSNNSGNGQTNVGVIGLSGAAQPTADIGRQVTQKELARPNTIRIPQGYQVAVLVSRDMSLIPYNE